MSVGVRTRVGARKLAGWGGFGAESYIMARMSVSVSVSWCASLSCRKGMSIWTDDVCPTDTHMGGWGGGERKDHSN